MTLTTDIIFLKNDIAIRTFSFNWMIWDCFNAYTVEFGLLQERINQPLVGCGLFFLLELLDGLE